jgi:hypothetical protein
MDTGYFANRLNRSTLANASSPVATDEAEPAYHLATKAQTYAPACKAKLTSSESSEPH